MSVRTASATSATRCGRSSSCTARSGPAGSPASPRTGAFGDRLGAPVSAGLPDEVAQERAATLLLGDGPFNVVRVGGSGYSVLTRDDARRRRVRGQRALLGRHRRDGRRALQPARTGPGRGRPAGRSQPRRPRRHQSLRRLRQERADPLRQRGRGPRPPLPRSLRGRRAQRPRPLRPRQGRGPRPARRPRRPHRPAGAPLRGARRGPGDGAARGGRVRGARRPA